MIQDREVVVLRDALSVIREIAYDYDGQGESLEGCKCLIDEIRHIAERALEGQSPIYFNDGDIINALDEIVGDYDVNDITKINIYDKNRKDY